MQILYSANKLQSSHSGWCVLGRPLRPTDLKSKSRHVEDTRGFLKNLDREILRKINKRGEDEELMADLEIKKQIIYSAGLSG